MSVNGEAAWLIAYAFDLLAQHLFGGNFSTLVDVEASKDEQFHGNSILTRRQPIIGRARPLVADSEFCLCAVSSATYDCCLTQSDRVDPAAPLAFHGTTSG